MQRAIPPSEAIVTHDSGSPRDQMLPFYLAPTFPAATWVGVSPTASARGWG